MNGFLKSMPRGVGFEWGCVAVRLRGRQAKLYILVLIMAEIIIPHQLGYWRHALSVFAGDLGIRRTLCRVGGADVGGVGSQA